MRVGPVKESRSPSAAPSRRLNCRIVERLANLRSVEATCPPDTGTLYYPLPCRNRGAAPGAHHPNKPKFSQITLAGRSSSETVVKKNFGLCLTPGDPDLGTNPVLRARPIQAYSQRVIKKNFGHRLTPGDPDWGPTRHSVPVYTSLFSKIHQKELWTSSDSWGLRLGTDPDPPRPC